MSKHSELFGDEWAELLKPFLSSATFNSIGHKVKADRANGTIIPEDRSELFFKAFRDLQPSKVKVICLGQDPYFNPIDAYDGYAFSCSRLLRPQPSLRNIIKEIENTYPDNLILDRQDLSYLITQGVFLVNTALSVKQYKADSHTRLWEPFTKYWIKALSEYRNDIIWCLWGTKAIKFERYISNPSHIALKTSHPSPLAAHKACGKYPPFLGSGIFREINNELDARGKNIIEW